MGKNAPEKLSPETLKAWRKRMEFNKTHACDALGCSREAWANWEGGRTRIPRYIGLAMAALALGMTQYGSVQK